MPAKNKGSRGDGSKAILIVDDHPMLRRGLRALIESEAGLSVCGEATSCAEALLSIEEKKPDLAIVDLGLEGSDGLELIREIAGRHPEIVTLVLSMHDESVYAERAFKAGARGYVTKEELDETILVAIQRVLEGKMHMSPKMEGRFAEKFLGGGATESGSPLDVLSDRELEVFRLIGRGESTRQIAECLGISVKTVESHRENLKGKLTLESGAALVRSAVLWVDTGEAS
jgi:DNA-binding NarL/FixJ family response regulator